jgi:hypothetical protein
MNKLQLHFKQEGYASNLIAISFDAGMTIVSNQSKPGGSMPVDGKIYTP